MKNSDLIPVKQVESGAKYTNAAGVTAIKNGQKKRAGKSELLRKPDWLRIRVQADEGYHEVRRTVHKHKLATVCEEAMCPNISECWS
jgi:lipoic acid synthetase